MRVVVYPHMLDIGGSQLNAIELAAAVRDLGHEVIVFGQPGPLVDRIGELGLEHVPAPRPGSRPSPAVMRALCRLVRHRGVDLVHGYEWTTALEAYWGPRTILGVPAVATVMSMAVAPFLPDELPLVVGTEQIAAHERARGRPWVEVIEPPVDLRHNDATAVDPASFRRTAGVDPEATLVISVTRLAADLKLEGVLASIDVVADLAAASRVQLVIVGDGAERPRVEAAAERANRRAGRPVVVLAGELRDPRPAYAAADVCLGMGGSALRAMAFARPVIVQGEQGFWELVTAESTDRFLWTGWYGVGPGAAGGRERLRSLLAPLLADGRRRAALGRYGLGLVRRRFALDTAGCRQAALYEAVAAGRARRPRALTDRSTSALGLLEYKVRRRVAGVLGRGAAEDFNARPVAAVAAASANRS